MNRTERTTMSGKPLRTLDITAKLRVHQRRERLFDVCDDLRPCVELDRSSSPGRAECASGLRLVDETADRGRQPGRVIALDQKPGAPVDDTLDDTPRLARNHGDALRHGLDRWNRKRLEDGGEDEDVGVYVELARLLVRHAVDERHALGQLGRHLIAKPVEIAAAVEATEILDELV